MTEELDFYQKLIDNLRDGIYYVDRQRKITYWNKGAEQITGYPAAQVVGRPCSDNILNHVDSKGTQLCLNQCPLNAVMEDGIPREVEVFLHHAGGHRLPVKVQATAMRNEKGKIVGAVEFFSNNTSLLRARRRLRELRRDSLTDPVTGLGNRKYLERRLQALTAAFEQKKSRTGLLFLDVDRFKRVNDQHGHGVGDRILLMVANTLRHNLRANDTIVRWSGDEFLVLLLDIPNTQSLRMIAEKLRNLVAASRLDLPDAGLAVTVSIGATLLNSKDTPESIIERADQLMYRGKQAGRNRIKVG